MLQNILIARPGPNWWVKIGDFGTSKRLLEDSTRTLVGTPGYLAPELMGLFDTDVTVANTSMVPYTSAVDIWALGEITHQILTMKLCFTQQSKVGYIIRGQRFPLEKLRAMDVSVECEDFIQELMAASPRNRPTAKEVLQLPWLWDMSVKAEEEYVT